MGDLLDGGLALGFAPPSLLLMNPGPLMPRIVAPVLLTILFLTTAGPSLALVSQENPPSDRVAELGGAVTFSGWKCPGNGGHHGAITMSVNGGPQEVIGARLSRGDTASVCKNDGRNGYATLRNLGIDGTGQHEVRFFDDGVQFSEATYNVTSLGESFVREAGRTALVRDFPRRGQTTTLQWTQGQQTFVPVGFCEGDCPCVVLEKASCAQKATGSTGVAATVCNFCDTPIAPSALNLTCSGQTSQNSAGATLIGPGQCLDVPCQGCEFLVPQGTCGPGDDATVTVVLTGDDAVSGGAICCMDDQATCTLDRECCSGTCVSDGGVGTCRPSTCGNGALDPGESCDGADLDGFTCEDVVGGADGCKGSLSCGAACGFDLSDCDCDCTGDLDCEAQIDCNGLVPNCTVFGACQNGKCATQPVGTAAVCLGADPEFGGPRCPGTP